MEIDQIKRFVLGIASDEEKKEVEEWMAASEERSRFVKDTGEFYRKEWPEEEEIRERVERIGQKILGLRITGETENETGKRIIQKPEIRRRTIRGYRRWMPAAAACAAILAGLFWGLLGVEKQKNAREIPSLETLSQAVQLILPDGSKHDLSSVQKEQPEIPGFSVGTQKMVQRKQVVSDSSAKPAVEYNEIIVPRGGEYMLVLADGTSVVLNSDTRLRFPETFTETERKVFLSGEAYFSVARNEQCPFLVEFESGQVRVLGTQFNVKAYAGQPTFATLVTGKVEVCSDTNSVVLQPGELCEISTTDRSLSVREADMMSVLAWKNGEFVFKDVSLKQVMEELSRWYDAEIEYDDSTLPDMKFHIYMDRAKTLEEALQVIARMGGITYRIEGKKVIIEKQ